MLKKLRFILPLLVLLLGVSCKEKVKEKTPEVNIVSSVEPSDGLDLKLVGSLFQDGKVTDASSLEQELNKDGGINNLDLNSDGNTDYINVSENKGSETVKSLDLTTGNDNDKTHIATLEVEKGSSGQYNIHMSGSEQIYGTNTTYRSSFSPSVSEMVFYSWLFSNSRPIYYHRPYHYGYYPSYYRPRVVVSRSVYRNRTTVQRTKVNKTTTRSANYKPKTVSKNVGKVSTKTRKSLNDSKTGNKSFKKQNSSNLKKNGFTNKNTTTTKSSTKPKTTTRTKKATSKSTKRARSRSRGSSRSRSSRSGRRSDLTYKTNVTNLDNALSVVKELNGVSYYWNTNLLDTNEKFTTVIGTSTDKSKQVGFIAQDVEKIAPLLVTEDEYGKRVNYDLTVAYLVEAIKEQQKQIEELKTIINNK